jgi:hypothetical protein
MALFLGICVGLILGITGSGGAILAVPILLFGLDLPPKVAIPMSLMAVALSSSIGALSALKSGHLRYKAVSLIAISGMVIAPLGVWLGNLLPNQPLMIIFAFALLYIGYITLFKKERERAPLLDESIDALPCEMNPKLGKLHWTKRCAQALALTGGITGFLSGLLGVGGGFVIIPALRKFSNIPMKQIVPTSLGVIAIISTFSLILFILTDRLMWNIAIPFSLGSVAGMLTANHFRSKINNHRIAKIFAIFLVIIAPLLIYKASFYVY